MRALAARSPDLLGRASGQAPRPPCGAPQARGLTAKARTERSSCHRDVRRRRTLSERSSTRFYTLVPPERAFRRFNKSQGFLNFHHSPVPQRGNTSSNPSATTSLRFWGQRVRRQPPCTSTASATWQIIDFPLRLPAPIVGECAFVFPLRGSFSQQLRPPPRPSHSDRRPPIDQSS